MQIFAIVVSLGIAAVGIALFVKAIREIIAVVKLGQPTAGRTDQPQARTVTLLKETLGHTRMLQWTAVGVGHWFVFVGFGLLFFTLLTAFGQLFDAHFALPLIGHFFLYEWVTELFTWAMLVAIVAFIGYRASRPKERERGTGGRFYGSTMWQGYFVELVILGVGLCIVTLRGLEYALMNATGPDDGAAASVVHFPLTFWLGEAFGGMSESALVNAIYLVAMLKIVISFTWMIVISLNTTMGVAWHRFTAFFNIFFKRRADGGTALGGLQPMMVAGEPIDFENIEDLDEDAAMGVGKIEDFAWKGILDFTSCTECGRCQSQCPAWNTDKPLSPKLLITNLRDHAYAKAPYLLADPDEREALPDEVKAAAERELVGATEGDPTLPTGGAVIDPDVLWSCTSCGACVQQCPVDIEHVDHIVDMRRYQVLIESSFPSELNGLFKGLENKGNPWNMSPNARMDWAKDLDFEVKVVGGVDDNDPADLDEVDWLFWVGCAGAYEDRAKKTTRAVAELLDLAGVSFAVLGDGETCTGDPARRSGNEFVFQQLAMQNAEVFKEARAKKVVSTCAHCFNTLKNEYSQFGVELEVVHHTQLLNRLVREGRLTPVAQNGAGNGRSITYHDPCYLGRHNQVYSPPRELLDIIPDAELKEMPRNSERSFCCGAGGARMWMEETIGERINLNRTTEALETGADQIATGCPFCRVMLSDGLTAKQADGSAREEVEVLDVAQLLLASVKRAPAPKPAAEPAAAAEPEPAAAATATAVLDRPEPTDEDEATKAEPEPQDVTQTEDTVTDPSDVGAAAEAGEDPTPTTEAPAAETEPADATPPDPAAADEPDASTEPEDDAAVKAQKKGDDTLF
jgi:Fe-S oxidoreductase